MWNECRYVMMIVLNVLIWLSICMIYLRQYKVKVVAWKKLGIRLLIFIFIFVITMIFVLESNYKIELLMLNIGIVLSIIIIFFLLILVMNLLFSIFLSKKYSFFSLIRNFIYFLTTISLKQLLEISFLIEICFLLICGFSMSSMILSYLANRYGVVSSLLQTSSIWILCLMVVSISVQLLSIFIHLILYKRVNQYQQEDTFIQRINIQNHDHNW